MYSCYTSINIYTYTAFYVLVFIGDYKHIFQTNLSYISFDNLNSNTEYVARFRTLINGTSNHTTDTPVQMTIDKTRTPDPVRMVQISNFNMTENTGLKALLTWEPSMGMCDINIV